MIRAMQLARYGLCGLLFLALASCEDKSKTPPGAGSQAKKTIAVIPKGTTHEFWKSIHGGANKAARLNTCPRRPL